jgi:ATP-dependent Clp protease, protease subunit
MKASDNENQEESQTPAANPYCEFELESYKALLDDRVILYNDVVNKSVIERIVLPLTTLANKNNQPIKLLINSPGGSVEDGQMVVDSIITSPVPVITVALGQAMSAAFDIFLAGDKRIVYPNTILMMHSGSSRFETQTLPQIGQEAELYRKYFERWSTWYSSRTNISDVKWLEMLSTGLNYYFFPEDSLKHGIAHEVIQPIAKPTLKKKFKL